MNKKAFTLTELLGVLVVLGVIFSIAIPVYNNLIKKSRDSLYQSYESKIADAAKIFVANCISKNKCANDKRISSYENEGINIESDLVQFGYIDSLKDPESSEMCSGSVYLKAYDNYDIVEYDYKVCLVCGKHKSAGCSNFEKPNPTIKIDLPSQPVKTFSSKIAVSTVYPLDSNSEYKYFLSTSTNPTSVGTLNEYTAGNNISINNLTGNYYVFVNQIKDTAIPSNLSIGGEVVNVSGKNYHRFGPIMMDNTGPSGCVISLSTTSKTPYLELTVSGGSSDLSGYSWEDTDVGSKYSKANNKKIIYSNGKYSIYAKDKLGNKSTCGTVNVTNIDNTAPQITYAYSGSHSGNCYYNSAKITANASSSTSNINKFERWTNNNTSQNYFVNDSVNSKTFSNSITFSEAGEHLMNSKATIILPNSNKIESSNASSTVVVDNSTPYTPYLSVSINRHSIKENTCGTNYKTGNVSCTIKYVDPCNLGITNSLDSVLTFTFYSTARGCSSVSFKYSENNSDWSNVSSADINSRLASVVSGLNGNWGQCKQNEKTVYVKSYNAAGHESGTLSIKLIRVIA